MAGPDENQRLLGIREIRQEADRIYDVEAEKLNRIPLGELKRLSTYNEKHASSNFRCPICLGRKYHTFKMGEIAARVCDKCTSVFLNPVLFTHRGFY